MSEYVLHADFVSLSSDAGPNPQDELFSVAAGLSELDAVISCAAIEGDEASDFQLAFLFLLRDFASLEPFGTDPRYSRFLQGTVAPVMSAFGGADLRLDTVPALEGHLACLALTAPEDTYDWEVRTALEDWASSAAASGSYAVGLTVGERQRYRGLALAHVPSSRATPRPKLARCESTLIRGAARILV